MHPARAPNPWHARADELADWALARFFVRRDRYGGYYAADGATRKTSRPSTGSVPNAVTRSVLLRHFRAARADDMCGAYLLTPEPSVGRCVAVDIDAHDDSADPDANARYGVELYAKLVALGFRPLLARWGGSCHLYALFATDQSGAALYEFGRSLVDGAPVETFPKQPSVPKDGYGNWLRVVGRHHTRDEWAEVFDGSTWLDGAAAVAHVLTLGGDPVGIADCGLRIADYRIEGNGGVAPRSPNPLQSSNPQSAIRSPQSADVLAEFNRSATLDEVCGWHEAHGHRVTRRGAARVEFVRNGKGAGESFNVMLFEGVPITYNFSSNAGIPANRGLGPAQVRCWYDTGSCDAAALRRFAAGLRAAGPLSRTRASPPGAGADDRLAELERRVEQLERDNRELARAVIALQERAPVRGAYCVRQ